MNFYPKQLFHIYNQGNNRQTLFFSDENYKYFLWKMRAYLLPFGDFIAWCLMPNHFHWLFYVRKVEIQRKELRAHLDKIEYQRRIHKYGEKAQPVNHAFKRYVNEDSLISLNSAVGDLEKAYTKAIHKKRGSSGCHFRQKCKAKDGWIDEFVTLKKLDGKTDYRFLSGTGYAYDCMQYIHENATKAGLVKKDIDWYYSSARDYAGLRKGSLCNLKLGHELLNYL